MSTLITGVAGFIGFHVATALLQQGEEVVGVDNLNDYYDLDLKNNRLALLNHHDKFTFHKIDITDKVGLTTLWQALKPDCVIHLAAQAGVRYSLEEPMAYIQSNIVGFQTVLECARQLPPRKLIYASSSSVYGKGKTPPFHEQMDTRQPTSLYAATKLANEHVATAYHHLFNLPLIGLRFFSAYGPWGRPDMAYFKFADLMTRGQPIPVYDQGLLIRDFTYIDDIVRGVLAASKHEAHGQVYNLGCGQPVLLNHMIQILEKELKITATKTFLPRQSADMEATLADISLAEKDLGYAPRITIEEGLKRFASWYQGYQKNKKPQEALKS